MSEAHKGVAAILAACTIWGLSGLLYKALSNVAPVEVLAHRVLWSFVFFAAVLLVQGRFGLTVSALKDRGRALRVLAATAMISFNWFLFISSVQTGKAVEASLGYYIFPLLSVLMGRFLFAELLLPAQKLAALLAAAAVLVLTLGLGVAPWVSLLLAGSFAAYGALKKGLDLGPVVSVTTEVLMLLPLALAVIWASGGGGFQAGGRDALLLMLSGPLTGLPLILFSYAARRVRLGTVGVLQYLNPTLQFMVAVLIFGELFTPLHGIAFALIWAGVFLFCAAALKQERRAARV
ncbi:EamA family transporter RarD [Cribrihabitans neustonicus]|uniref:EamA family transporter RarD n=1 Tax=Cribrihabitans neustonicus TaxID=1429085 RepID=UPI003B5A8110